MSETFLDSLSIVMAYPKHYFEENTFQFIDIGTGAGFPSIPIKIVFPNLKFTLVDSLNKRIKFLNEVIDQLQLLDCTAVHGRAEDLAKIVLTENNMIFVFHVLLQTFLLYVSIVCHM